MYMHIVFTVHVYMIAIITSMYIAHVSAYTGGYLHRGQQGVFFLKRFCFPLPAPPPYKVTET